jgi:hypothetical protein
MKIIKLAILVLIVFLCSSCSWIDESEIESLPGVSISLGKMNSQIQLIDPPVLLNTHKFGKSLALRINNLSDSNIVFPYDFGTKIFVKESDSWIPVQNTMGYPDGDNYLRTRDVVPSGIILVVDPSLSNFSSKITIRVVVVGKTLNEVSEDVGAYLDVEMQP